MSRTFRLKRTRKKKTILSLLFLFLILLGIGYANIDTNLGIAGTISLLKNKPVLTIHLDNQNATTPGTNVYGVSPVFRVS